MNCRYCGQSAPFAPEHEACHGSGRVIRMKDGAHSPYCGCAQCDERAAMVTEWTNAKLATARAESMRDRSEAAAHEATIRRAIARHDRETS